MSSTLESRTAEGSAGTKTVRSVCRCCTAGCGIVATVVNGELVSVRGDRDHPLSHGYICPKGASLPWTQNRPERLDHPTIDGRQVGWDEFVADLAARLRTLVAEHGGNCIGWFEGTGTPTDVLGRDALVRVFHALGSTRHYSAATIDIAPTWAIAELVTGYHRFRPLWIPEDEESRFVLLLGGNPAVSHGYQTLLTDPFRRIKAFRARGGQLWVVDPRRTKTARLADRHLSIRPGTDYILLAFLLREVLARREPDADFLESTSATDRERLLATLRPYTLEETARRTDIPEASLMELADVVVGTPKVAIMPGTGITFQRHAVPTEWLRWVLLCVTGSLDRPGGMWFNPGWFEQFDQRTVAPAASDLPLSESRPELGRLGGQLAVVTVPEDIEAGHLRAFFVNGGNPARSFPEPGRVERALRSLDLLVVFDVVETATTKLATHVAPVTGQMERMDLAFEVTRAMLAPAVVEPPSVTARKPGWWIAAKLARHFDLDVLGGEDEDLVSEETLMRTLLKTGRTDHGDLMDAGTHGVALKVSGFMRRTALPGGTWNILPPEVLARWEQMNTDSHVAGRFVFVTGRQLTRNGSIDYVPPARRIDDPSIVMSPNDAQEVGATAGTLIRVTSRSGSVIGKVRIDANMRPGTLSFAQGWSETHSAALCSLDDGVDPLSGQPTMSGIPVELELVAS